MGVDEFIKNMPPGLKKLYMNIFSIVIIGTLLYGAYTFIDLTIFQKHPFIYWFSSPHFTTVVVIIVMVMVGSKILKGGRIKVPEEFLQKKGKSQFNFPDTWGVKKYKGGSQQQQQPPNPQQGLNARRNQSQSGSWTCPNCGFMVIGNQCPKCGGFKR